MKKSSSKRELSTRERGLHLFERTLVAMGETRECDRGNKFRRNNVTMNGIYRLCLCSVHSTKCR